MPGQFTPLKLLVDTNVWLGNYLGARPGHNETRAFFDAALKKGACLAYAATSVKDVYYVLNASLKQQHRAEAGALDDESAAACEQAAFSCVENMRDIGIAVGVDNSDIWLASKFRAVHADFEDDLVMAVAKRAEADYLVTDDERLLRHAVVPALSPKDMTALLESL